MLRYPVKLVAFVALNASTNTADDWRPTRIVFDIRTSREKNASPRREFLGSSRSMNGSGSSPSAS
jgi:hypothetical protein